MEPHYWSPEARAVTLVLDGAVTPGVTRSGADEVDDIFCLMFNAALEPLAFVMPPLPAGASPWKVLVDTADDEPPGTRTEVLQAGDTVTRPDLSLLLAVATHPTVPPAPR